MKYERTLTGFKLVAETMEDRYLLNHWSYDEGSPIKAGFIHKENRGDKNTMELHFTK
jgi:hypothetical protein